MQVKCWNLKVYKLKSGSVALQAGFIGTFTLCRQRLTSFSEMKDFLGDKIPTISSIIPN